MISNAYFLNFGENEKHMTNSETKYKDTSNTELIDNVVSLKITFL